MVILQIKKKILVSIDNFNIRDPLRDLELVTIWWFV